MIVIFTIKEDKGQFHAWLRKGNDEVVPFTSFTAMNVYHHEELIEAVLKEFPGALLLPPEQFDAWTSFFSVVDATIKIATKTLFFLSDGKHAIAVSILTENEKYAFYDIVPGPEQDYNFFRNGGYFVTDATRRDDVESIAKGNGIDLTKGWKWIQETEDDRAYRKQHNINR